MTESYKKFTQIEHVLARPGMYIGDTKCTTADAWTINDENKAVFKNCKWNPGIYKIFDEIPKDSLETQALKIDITFYCYKCAGMATGRTCPCDDSSRLAVSGTRLREMFANKETVPNEFSRPEVLEVLSEYYDAQK